MLGRSDNPLMHFGRPIISEANPRQKLSRNREFTVTSTEHPPQKPLDSAGETRFKPSEPLNRVKIAASSLLRRQVHTKEEECLNSE